MPKIENTFSIPPFPAFPSSGRYVPLGSVEETLGRIGRSIEARESIALVMGPSGTGKSLICQLIRQRYQESHEVVVLGDTPIEDRAALLRHLLHHLGVDHVAGPANDLHLALVDQVCSEDAAPDGLLIVVDEGQSLEPDVLEAIRMTTNIMHQGRPRVAAIVCGGVKLEETLTLPALEPFNQRVATRCYLHPMSADETRDYITSIIGQCGADPETTITDEAIAAVHHGCDGVARLVNQLMTQAIDAAEAAGQELIDETIIDRAWSTLQQLPSTMLEPPTIGGAAKPGETPTAIEFGELQPLGQSESDIDPLLTETQIDASTKMVIRTGEPISEDECDEPDCGTAICQTQSVDDDIVIEVGSASWVEEIQPPTDEAIASLPASAPPATALFGEFEYEEEVSVGQSLATTAKPASAWASDRACVPAASPAAVPAVPPAGAEAMPSCCGSDLGSSCDSVAETALPSSVRPEPTSQCIAGQEISMDTFGPEPVMDGGQLESSLHQEIIGLTSYDETAVVLPDVPEMLETDSNVAEPVESEPAESEATDRLETTDQPETTVEPETALQPQVFDQAETTVDVNGPALRFVAEAAQRPPETTFESRPKHDDSDLLVYEEDLDDQSEPAGLSTSDQTQCDDDQLPIAIDFQSMLTKMRTGT